MEKQKFKVGDKGNSKVVNVTGSGTWYSEKQNVEYFKFDYILENGLGINAMHKTDKHYEVGDVVGYEVKRSNQYGFAGTIGKPQQEGGYKPGPYKEDKGRQNIILVQSSMTKAVDLFLSGHFDDMHQELKKQQEGNHVIETIGEITKKLINKQLQIVKKM